MKLQNIRIAVGITTSGDAQVLYCGFDSKASLDAAANAGPGLAEAAPWPVGVMPLKPRYPAKEAKDAEARLKAKEEKAVSADKAKLAEADKHDEQAIKHSQAAQAIRESITPEAAAIQETFLKSAKIIIPEATLAPKKSKK